MYHSQLAVEALSEPNGTESTPMPEKFNELPTSTRWAALVEACKRAVRSQGDVIEREAGRGLSNRWRLKRGEKYRSAAFRTTQDRWLAFAPLESGKRWKTLDDVDAVVVATVDKTADPRKVEVYLFDRDEVRSRFVAAWEARAKAGQSMTDGFGFWINGDLDSRGIPQSVGSGLFALRPPIAVYEVKDLLTQQQGAETPIAAIPEPAAPLPHPPQLSGATIAEVLKTARERIAHIAGVPVEAVRLELKLET